MKRTTGLLLACALLATSPLALAQDAGLEAKYDKKLQKEFATKIKWVHTLKEAQERAKKENKLIFGYFTRSYAP